MNDEDYLKHRFESIADYRKTVLLLFLFRNDENFLREIGFSEHDIDCLILKFKTILTEKYEEYLDFIKNEEESVIERFLNK